MSESDEPVGEQLVGPKGNQNREVHYVPNLLLTVKDLAELLSRITDENQHPAVDWGEVGGEVVE